MPNSLLESQLKDFPPSKRVAPVRPALGIGAKYNSDMQKMLREIREYVKTAIMPMLKRIEPEYTADSWSDVVQYAMIRLQNAFINQSLDNNSNRIASDFVNASNQANKKRYNQQMKSMGINAYADSPEISAYLDASVADNAKLIKSVNEKYIGQIENIVNAGTRSGLRPEYIQKQLTEQFGIESRRSKFIARDQTSKVAGQLNQMRQTTTGFKYFRWLDSKDGRVRSRHKHIADKETKYGVGVYRWDDLPLSDKGIPIAPGDDYQCRCTAIPVIQSQVDAYEKDHSK